MSHGEHVGPVIFSREEPRRQLEEEGEVVTVRGAARTTGETWWRASRTGPKRGDVEIQRIAETIGGILDEHVQDSGFESVEDWQTAIVDLHGRTAVLDCALYRVVAL